MAKKLGIFEFPGVKGAKVQDLEVGAVTYPLTIWFPGSDTDLVSEDFFTECAEKGRWKIIHPVKGGLELQLVSVTENIQPVSSGGLTQFDTEWIEPLDAGTVLTPPLLFSDIGAMALVAGAAAALQFASFARTDTAGQVGSLKSSVTRMYGNISKTVRTIGDGGEPATNALVAQINGLLGADPIDTAAVAQGVTDLITLDAENTDSVRYEKFAQAMDDAAPETATVDDLPTIAIQEIALSAAVIGFSTAAINAELQTRRQALALAEKILALLRSTIDTLDETQTLFEDNAIDRQYFSQTQAYSDLLGLSATTARFLFQSSFDLKTEKRFKIKGYRAPIEIVIAEYGTLGTNDENLTLFIESNKLKSKEILILDPGREIVVYL